MEKHIIVISREWNNPQIEISVTDVNISIKLSLPDFIDAITQEIAHPIKVYTKKGLREQIVLAAESVCEKMKLATTRVMS